MLNTLCPRPSAKRDPLKRVGVLIVTLLLSASSLYALDVKVPDIMHPMKNPKMYTKTMECPNCGMMINMWARTRHSFSNHEGEFETCSIRCLADLSAKAGEKPENVKVAVYTEPEKMVSAHEAVYVVGSSAKGTMTMKSKIAFADKESAEKFVGQYGGEIQGFEATLKNATMEVDKMRAQIQSNRMGKGKISEPVAATSCSLCGMPPASFPAHRSQLTTTDGENLHFCSSKCLVNYVDEHKDSVKPQASWVTVYPDGDYEFVKGLYYVVGSSVMGPMGPEALPFRKKADAEALIAKQGGRIVRWSALTPEAIVVK
nr:nitrous oxide reductase accessory protein NosL [Desulfobulbaceae bacterium]